MAGLAVLALLAGVAGWLWAVQARFHPAVRAQLEAAQGLAGRPVQATGAPNDVLKSWPEGLKPLNPPERFDAAGLSDKIDGKAELYLASGFKSLTAQRFGPAASSAWWAEVFVFEMTTPEAAFAVFSQQKRADAGPSDLTPRAYGTKNAVFFTAGRFYLEIVASGTGAVQELARVGRQYLAENAPISAEPRGRRNLAELFPRAGQDERGPQLMVADALGFSGWDNVYLAAYGQKSAFFTRRASAGEAGEMARKVGQFFKESGGRELPPAENPAGARIFDLFGGLEVVFSQGPFVAGVHEARTREEALALAQALAKSLSEAGE